MCYNTFPDFAQLRMSLTGLDASRFTRATKIIAVADVVESVRLMERAEHDFISRWQHFVDYVQDRLASRELSYLDELGFTPRKEFFSNGEAIQVYSQPGAHSDGDAIVFRRDDSD